MAKAKRKIDVIAENQLNLFEMINEINPKKFAREDYQKETKPLGIRLKEAISEAIKNSGLKRYEIAGKMAEFLIVVVWTFKVELRLKTLKIGQEILGETILQLR